MIRKDLHHLLFESDSPQSRLYDHIMVGIIILSVIAVLSENVFTSSGIYHMLFYYAEWFFTLLFTLEYILRIIASFNAMIYILSFFGVIDLLSFLPTYFSLFSGGFQIVVVIRMLRLLRLFRAFKLLRYVIPESSKI